MSLIDIEQLSPLALVTQYILETRGKGHFVTRDEAGLIQSWLNLANNEPEAVIVALEDILPKKVAKAAASNKKAVSLTGLNRSVIKRLSERNALIQ